MGCTLKPPPPTQQKDPVTKSLILERDKETGRYVLNPLFEITIEDIFNKYDMMMNNVLGFQEFKGFLQAIGKHGDKLTPQEFRSQYLKKFQSTDKGGLAGEEGLTLKGFKDFFYDEIQNYIKETNKISYADNFMF